jgi:hypothetical protein
MRASEFVTEASNKYDQQTIDLIKTRRDNRVSVPKIANELGLSVNQVQHILGRYYTDREKQRRPIDTDTIDLVKRLWDQGKKSKAIATELGLTISSVRGILTRFYKSRPGLIISMVGALTDEDRAGIVSEFLNSHTTTKIADAYGVSLSTILDVLQNELGVERYNAEMAKRKAAPGVQIRYKITPEMLVKMRELYAAGKTLAYISDHFANVITTTAIGPAMKRQPDYAEIRAKRDENTRKVKHSPVATTKITRAGEVDNLRSKGPGNKNTWGMFPSTKWGMHKP